MKNILRFILTTLLITAVLFSLYYVFFLKPDQERLNDLIEAEKILTLHKTNLTQNRLSYVALTKLDPGSLNFDPERSELVLTLRNTGKDGLQLIKDWNTLPRVERKLNERFPLLLDSTENVYRNQDKLLEKVFATSSYEDGLDILKSTEAIILLTQQSNLILEYGYWINIIKENQK